MVNATEIIVSVLFLLFAAILLYNKIKSKQCTEKIEAYPAKLKEKQNSKITFWRIVILAVVIVIGSYIYQNNVPGATYTFSSVSDLTNDWQVVSGNWVVQNDCLIGSGEIRLKNSAVMPPDIGDACGAQDFSGLSFKIGEVIIRYNIKTARELGENSEGSYHTADIHYQKIDEKKLLSFPMNKYIKSDESAWPYPLGINRNKWWDFLSPRFEVNVYILNDLLAKNTLALYNGGEKKDEEGGFSIKSDKVIEIKKIEIFY